MTRDAVVPILVVGMLGLMILPVPSFFLDSLLAVNITIALAVMLTAMRIDRPLDFSVFPALLLVTTLCFAGKTMLGEARRNMHLVLFPVIQICAYSFWIFGQWFYSRYYYSTMVLLILWIGLLFQEIVNRTPRLQGSVRYAVLAFAVVVGTCSWNSLPQKWCREEFSDGSEHQISLSIIREHVPPGAKIGGFQSGAFEYLADEWGVVNLDGVVNADALTAMKTGQMSAYLRENDIQWILDLDWIIDALYVRFAGEADPLATWELVASSGNMRLYHALHDHHRDL